MTSLLLSVLAATAITGAQTDTTFAVATGSRLEVENFGGSISVTAWNKNALRIQAEHGRRTEVIVTRDGATIGVDSRHTRGVPTSVDYQLTVPVWMPLKLSGTYTDIAVEGTRARVEAETVQGDVSVTGGAEYVALESVDGTVTASGCMGRVELSAVNDDVRADGVEGELIVDALNGNVWLYGTRADVVEASTVNGDVVYDGELRDGGRYELSTHSGDVALAVPERAGVTVTVATFTGNLEASFPLQLSETKRGKRFKFTLGDGGAAASLESFDGTVYLVRPGAAILKHRPQDHDEADEHEAALEKKHEKAEKHEKK